MAGDPVRTVGGEVVRNDFGEDDPEPGEESLYDSYDTVVDVWVSGPTDEELLHRETGRLFDEIIGALPWPAAHTKVTGKLYSAWDPNLGRADFPAGTAYDAGSRTHWERYVRR